MNDWFKLIGARLNSIQMQSKINLTKKSSHPPYILGHNYNSKSIRNMESYAISVDTQSNFAYYEYDLRVLVAFLTNPYIWICSRGSNQKPAKSPCNFAASIQWYGLLSIWWQDFGT